ncbi:hypothetical protein F5B22DRAFT_643978 [Xylaria bambusicola]|uniref:uncharacterized protein n=1 Tax=Xylaria bambusicola TaxID=326684 RepID=UPI00200841B8|nr:uncharacterized protein F5B22DRAFT_643978 [Xylaria bambusicola]KAI0521251.1 hypothetical protein F5B22DRAFT_643978 [Xylaria bambusicola]
MHARAILIAAAGLAASTLAATVSSSIPLDSPEDVIITTYPDSLPADLIPGAASSETVSKLANVGYKRSVEPSPARNRLRSMVSHMSGYLYRVDSSTTSKGTGEDKPLKFILALIREVQDMQVINSTLMVIVNHSQ